ncbi:uncharacterized protein LOC108091046 [Drosophila ficusphila]|uniref:uncharacterized protein LOC108091046 n=1 Tax=Drosophila ficusphila TaxID=30025 RepID=UPI001C898618|nr:uncharacterized protein LOC108091046 [Drosophila ficusphila]
MFIQHCDQDTFDRIVNQINSSPNSTYKLVFDSPEDPCSIVLKNILNVYHGSPPNKNSEVKELIRKINTAIEQKWSTERKAKLLKEFLEYTKLSKYLNHILLGKIDECDMRLATVKSRKCWNYYTKLKVMFNRALNEANVRKQYLIGNISMMCSENAV